MRPITGGNQIQRGRLDDHVMKTAKTAGEMF